MVLLANFRIVVGVSLLESFMMWVLTDSFNMLVNSGVAAGQVIFHVCTSYTSFNI